MDPPNPPPPNPPPADAPRNEGEFRRHYKAPGGLSFRAGLPSTRVEQGTLAGDYRTSGSKLGVEALLAFRVVPMFDLKAGAVIPGYDDEDLEPARPGFREAMLDLLSQADAVALGLVSLATLPSNDLRLIYREELMRREQEHALPGSPLETSKLATAIVDSTMSDFLGNPFLTVFTAIRDLRARLLAEKYEDVYDGLTSKQSGEIHEDKAERGSEELLHRLMDVILLYFSQQTEGEDWFRSTPGPSSLQIPLKWDPTEQRPVVVKKGPGRPPNSKKNALPKPSDAILEEDPASPSDPSSHQPTKNPAPNAISVENPVPEKRGPGRPRKNTVSAIPDRILEEKPAPKDTSVPPTTTVAVPKRRGRPRKTPLPEEKPADDFTIPTTLYCTAVDDGYLYLGRAGKTTGSNRYSKIPIVRYEAKRLDLDGWKEKRGETAAKNAKIEDKKKTPDSDSKKKDGKTEQKNPKDYKPGDLKVAAQQFVEMLTGIYTNAAYANERVKKKHDRQQEKKRFEDKLTRAERAVYDKAQNDSEISDEKLEIAETRRKAAADKLLATAKQPGRPKPFNIVRDDPALRRKQRDLGLNVKRTPPQDHDDELLSKRSKIADLDKIGKPQLTPQQKKAARDQAKADEKAAKDKERADKKKAREKEQAARVQAKADRKKLTEVKARKQKAGKPQIDRQADVVMEIEANKPVENAEADNTEIAMADKPVENAEVDNIELMADKPIENAKVDNTEITMILDYPDQEAFNIRIRHTYLSICWIRTPKDYLTAVSKKPCLDERDETIEFRQTEEYNLLYADQRRRAGKAIWALLAHLHSGRAEIGRLQGASRQSGLALYRPFHQAVEIVMPKERRPPQGMPNVGGLQCYANSAIQGITAAISLRDFRRLVKPDPVSNSIRGTFLRTVARLIGGDQTDLVSLLRIVSTTHRREIKANAETPSYDGDSQEDPAEFLLFLLDKLWEAHSEMKNLVTFTQRTTTKCSNPLCNTESVNITHNYTQLVLRVKAQDTMCTLYDALAPDTVETWRCPKECKTLSQKTVSFDTLPGILVVQLERTEHFFPGQTTEINGVKESVYNSVVKARQEYQKKVVEWEARLQQRRAAGMPTTDLDEEFKKWKNLQEGIPVKLDTPVDLFSADHSSFQTFNLTSDDEKTPVQYELYAVMCHKGETNIAGGHYVAYVLHDDETKTKQPEWYLLNDSKRTGPVDIPSIAAALRADPDLYDVPGGQKYYWKEGYWGSPRMLFYRRPEGQTSATAMEIQTELPASATGLPATTTEAPVNMEEEK